MKNDAKNNKLVTCGENLMHRHPYREGGKFSLPHANSLHVSDVGLAETTPMLESYARTTHCSTNSTRMSEHNGYVSASTLLVPNAHCWLYCSENARISWKFAGIKTSATVIYHAFSYLYTRIGLWSILGKLRNCSLLHRSS